MAKEITLTTGRASLCALGEHLRRQCVFAPFRAQSTSPQKTGISRPTDKWLDGVVGRRCGAKTMAQSNGTVRVEPAGQRALGRQGCADQSTIARTRQACPTEHGAPWDRGS